MTLTAARPGFGLRVASDSGVAPIHHAMVAWTARGRPLRSVPPTPWRTPLHPYSNTIKVAMVKQQKMQSFFKRKGDEEIVKSPLAPDALALVPYMDGRHDEDAQEGQMEDEWAGNVVEFCVEHDIDIPDMEELYILRGGRARRQPDHFTRERYLRVEIFRATIDNQLTELNLRFNEKVMDLLSISVTLIPRNGFTSFNAKEICSMVEKYYPADFTQQERYGLEIQLNHFVVDAKNSGDLKKPITITSLCRCLVETERDRIYNLLDRLLRLLVTLPVSTASAERAFSSLKIIKSRLRSQMEDDFLADSLLLQIEREIASKIPCEDIIADFKSRKNRRAYL